MFAQQFVHIVLIIPLNSSLRNYIFIYTSIIYDQFFLLKKPRDMHGKI